MLWLAPLPLLLGGCHALRNSSCNAPQVYMRAQSVPALKIPAGLDAPETTSALRIPVLNEPAPPPRGAKDPCLDAPPRFKVRASAPAPQA
jgi:hypothetical protein